jgi:alkanesulfonate monooxygenase SsuD/methylene tetrahydromethanopterin reductase-like flavin-dependent oxidoreductase (luciferase family)
MTGFGLHLPTFDPVRTGERRPITQYARQAEAAGFDALWAGDHLWCPSPALEATTCLAAAAAVTERVALGFSVLLAGIRQPAFTAKSLQTIDQLAPGRRLVLGVGVGGEFAREFELAGLRRSQRGRLLDDALDQLPALLTDKLEPAISALPPVYIGGRGDAALERVARVGDGWLPIWVSPDRIRSTAQRLGELAAERGRPAPKIALLLGVCVDADEARARAAAEGYLRGQYRMGLDQVERWNPVGSVERIRDYVYQHIAAGVHEFVLMPLTPRPLGQVDPLASVVEGLG